MVSENLRENIGSNTCQLVKPMLSGALSPYAPNMRKHLLEHKPEMIMHAAFVFNAIKIKITTDVGFIVNNMKIGVNILMLVKGSNVKNFIGINRSRTFLHFCWKHAAKFLNELEKTDYFFRNEL
tara:strand:- start:67 stop:438 length:372 start_codon:yes stop_codon:yes gene_type:complete